jgi:hypothetical protein
MAVHRYESEKRFGSNVSVQNFFSSVLILFCNNFQTLSQVVEGETDTAGCEARLPCPRRLFTQLAAYTQ